MDYPPPANYEEGKVGPLALPDPLLCIDGTAVDDLPTWQLKRRKELLQLFADNVYGTTPNLDNSFKSELLESNENALGGRATRRTVRLSFFGSEDFYIDLQIISPRDTSAPHPAILGANFFGNHAVLGDADIAITQRWMRDTPDSNWVILNQATESSRGCESERWQVDQIIEAGFSLATFYYGDVESDHPEGWKGGVRGVALQRGFTDSWGAIAAWAWGLSRALDYLEFDSSIDATEVFVMGHSRLGKAAIWAGANDSRFAGVISNNSGAGGVALARRNFGESIQALNENFPHWFCEKFATFNSRPNDLPVDMHQLIALIAPRPIYIASASEDLWADPKGEFLAALHAQSVYQLFGKVGVGTSEWPAIETPVGHDIYYHLRRGGHGVTAYDWEQFLIFLSEKRLKQI
jgi:hypothetical protein